MNYRGNWLPYLILSLCSIQGSVLAQTRIIPHVTRADGGFTTTILVQNEDIAAGQFTLSPFTDSGSALSQRTAEIDGMALASFSLEQLFPEQEGIAYFTIEAGEDLNFTASYSAATGNGSPAHVTETDETSSRFRLFAGNWERVFDGVAVVNMGNEPATIWLTSHQSEGSSSQPEAILNLQPGAKGLYVLGGPGVENAIAAGDWFEINSGQPMAVTALRGNLPGSDFLWVNPVTPYHPAVVKVTNDRPGNQDNCADPTTFGAHAPDLNNMPQGEVWIDVSPSGQLISTAKDYRYSPVQDTYYNKRLWSGLYISDDQGNSWNNLMYLDSDPNQGITGTTGTGYGQTPNQEVIFRQISDPVVAYDRDGNIYTCGLAFDSDFDPNVSILSEPSSLTIARRSPNGELEPDRVHLLAVENSPLMFNDKNWLAVDKDSDPDQATVVVSWRLFASSEAPASPGPYISVSGDGAQSFSEPIKLPLSDEDAAGTQFYHPIIGQNPATGRKTLWLSFRSGVADDFSYQVSLLRITIDGLDPGTPALEAHLSNPNNWEYMPGILQNVFVYGSSGYDGAFRFNSYFIPTQDPTNGDLWAVGGIFSPGNQNMVVVAIRSTDGGATWTAPVEIDPFPVGFQLMPAPAANNGILSVVWYDTRNDQNYAPFSLITALDVYYAEMNTRMETVRTIRLTPESQKADHPAFTRPFPDQMAKAGKKKQMYPHDMRPMFWMTPHAAIPGFAPKNKVSQCFGYGFIGDYNGMAADADFAYAVWGDLRDIDSGEDICSGGDCFGRRNQNVYFGRIRKNPGQN